MKFSNSLQYLRPPKLKPIRSPFTRPTTYVPPTLPSITRKIKKQIDFNHIVHHAIPASAKGTSSRPAPGIRKEFYFVHFKDRIKFWNLTAGDRVIIADCTQRFRGKIGTIYWVDRTTNRLGLLEPEFWKEEKQSGHPKFSEFTRHVPIEFEYSTVRLMAPGSNDMYYEDLREVDHEAVIIPNGGKRREIHWTRIGTRYCIHSPRKQSEGQEIIPWPVTPHWPINIQDSAKRLELKEQYVSRMQAEWALETRRRNGEQIGPILPTSHVHSREMRKDLFASPLDAWSSSLDRNLYEDTALWLSTSPIIRARFADYFAANPHALHAIPELAVADWELSAGQHTRRAKTLNWESKLAAKINEQIKTESRRISQHVKTPVEEIERLMRIVYYRPSMVERPNKSAPSKQQVKRAQIQLDSFIRQADKRERLATLDLLPALECFNSTYQPSPSESSVST
ncbi:hypothetical protein O181_050341 [Austropuccinia psidii MF-1]|uniref:Uncharacterized protein n=1 Tax=Austropuccinia psidii MF-1 TaxID=1389203 RepID=A0A9Q3HM99_9BASI|nr:hypothetical protein [Austropuccinia psidii MF-1]